MKESDVLAVQNKLFRSELEKRFIVGGLLLLIAFVCIYKGPPASLILGVLLALLLAGEWIRLLLQRSTLPLLGKMCLIVFGSGYIAISVGYLFSLLAQKNKGIILFWMIGMVVATDTAAYLGGRLLGGPRLAPRISPNKTWSGFICGMLGGSIIGYTFMKLFHINSHSLTRIAFLVLCAQLGDLLESQFKRWSRLKDSSRLLPGHGGVLDRLDSLLAVAFVLAIYRVIKQ